MVVAINYSNKQFRKAASLNSFTAKRLGKVDKVISFTPEDIEESFRLKNSKIFENFRGDGLWLWKPYFIHKSLLTMDEGDYLVYVDSGICYLKNIDGLLNKVENSKQDIFFTETPLLEVQYTHPDVFNIMLQILDEGHITDSLGRKVDFRNTVIIMTSNIGSRQLKEFGTGVGFSTGTKIENKESDSKQVIENALKKYFSPEFLNRIDDVIVFNSLEKPELIKILDIQIEKMLKRIKDLGYSIKLTDEAKEFLADKGFDSAFGARPLQRAIQKYLEDPLAEEILKGDVIEGKEVLVELDKENNILKVNAAAPDAPVKKGRKVKTDE